MNPRTFFAYNPADNESIRLEKFTIFLVASSCSIAGIVWAMMYFVVFGWGLTTALPLGFTVIVGLAMFISHRTKNHLLTIYAQIICIIYITALIQWSIGSVFDSGVVLVWAFMGPVCALMFFPFRQAAVWFVLFFFNLIITVVFNDFFVANGQDVTENIRLLFFIMNLGISSIIVFGFASYYVNLAIREQDKTNQLLQTNLQQAIALQQSEKLATLGKLSAGVAHELNNPAAATQRGTAQLKAAVSKYEETALKLGQLHLTPDQFEAVTAESQALQNHIAESVELSALARSDREYEIESWLEDNGLESAWELAPPLVEIGYTVEGLDPLARKLNQEQLATAASLLVQSYTIHNVLAEVGHGSGRISEIVNALKSYTYLDQAPTQSVDLNQGLENTLVVLASKLDEAIIVRREFAQDLPPIECYGSELNQVWTSIIENAIDAMDGAGELVIHTSRENSWAVVNITDSGPGFPPDIKEKLFDPFFTTKPPGKGTGLGLNICHNIIVQKHKGEIAAYSTPGQTRFEVKLPIA